VKNFSVKNIIVFGSTALLPLDPISAADYVILSGQIDTTGKSVGDVDTVVVEEGGVLSVNDTAIKWNAESTGLVITNDGIIESIADGGRAINAGGSDTVSRTLTLINGASGVIRSQNDAFRINTDITGGSVRLENAGTIISTGTGQALDFDAVTSAPDGLIQIDNLAGGIIQSTDADALRPGQGAIINNYGTIYAGKVDNLSSDAVDLQNHSATINNYAGGLISGARHGITTDQDLSVFNEAGGTIIGRNGSGIGSDGNGYVINHGTITGAYDGSGTGDGDGIDIDGVGYVENYGTIEALGWAGNHSDGRPNGSDAVTFGWGGTFINHEGATVYSVVTGVAFGLQTTIVNAGTIHAGGQALFTHIGDDVVTNSGLIQSDSGNAIFLGPGNDSLTLLPGSKIIGSVDGGEGADVITLGGQGAGSFDGAVNFERLNVESGHWTLTGASSFVDGTFIARDAVLNGSSAVLTGDITNEGTLVADQPGDAVFAARLFGTGTFVKAGVGTMAVGDQPFTGATRVADGTLLIAGRFLSDVRVGAGATLTGAGTIGSLVVEKGGAVALMADGPRLLAIEGDFLQQAGSAYRVTLEPDLPVQGLAIGGAATIEQGATLAVALSSDAAVGQSYVVLTAANGVNGSYALLADTDPLIEVRLLEDGHSISAVVARTASSLMNTAETVNQSAVVAGLTELGAGNALYDAVTLEPSNDTVKYVLNSLSGQLHASVRNAVIHDAQRVADATRQRSDGAQAQTLELWGRFLGGHARDGGKNGVWSGDADSFGALIGADTRVDGTRIGVAGGYSRSQLELSDGATRRAHIDGGHLIGYAGKKIAALSLKGGGGYSWQAIRTERRVSALGISDNNQARYKGHQVQGYIELAYDLPLRGSTIQPFAQGEIIHTVFGGFTESGGDTALVGRSRAATLGFSKLGGRLNLPLAANAAIAAGAAWGHSYGPIRATVPVAFAAGQGSTFIVDGTALSRDLAALSLDLGWRFAPNGVIGAGYAGRYGRSSNVSSGHVTLSIGLL